MEADKLAHQKPLTILLAEDNKVNQILTLGLLRSLGYTADLAHDGKLAIEAVGRREYDLVLMDCELPIINGYEASRLIHETFLHPPAIVAYTAHVSEREMARCRAAGMEYVLGKPISLEALIEILIQIHDVRKSVSEES